MHALLEQILDKKIQKDKKKKSNLLSQWLSSKEFACNAGAAGEIGSIPGWRRSPGGRNGNPLQYSCLENPMDGRAWQATDRRVGKSQTGLK